MISGGEVDVDLGTVEADAGNRERNAAGAGQVRIDSMNWDRAKPWTAPARTLVLYKTGTQLRFAAYNDAGIMDGYLGELPAGCEPETAQAELVAKVEHDTGIHYVATSSSDKPGWCAVELSPSEAPTR